MPLSFALCIWLAFSDISHEVFTVLVTTDGHLTHLVGLIFFFFKLRLVIAGL